MTMMIMTKDVYYLLLHFPLMTDCKNEKLMRRKRHPIIASRQLASIINKGLRLKGFSRQKEAKLSQLSEENLQTLTINSLSDAMMICEEN